MLGGHVTRRSRRGVPAATSTRSSSWRNGAPHALWIRRLLALVRDFYAQGKIVAAICLSGRCSQTGVLEGKRATVFRTDRSLAALKRGRVYVNEPSCATATSSRPRAARGAGFRGGDRENWRSWSLRGVEARLRPRVEGAAFGRALRARLRRALRARPAARVEGAAAPRVSSGA